MHVFLTFWSLEACRRGSERLETELDVFPLVVSKRAAIGNGQGNPYQERHSLDYEYVHATPSILCDLAI